MPVYLEFIFVANSYGKVQNALIFDDFVGYTDIIVWYGKSVILLSSKIFYLFFGRTRETFGIFGALSVY